MKISEKQEGDIWRRGFKVSICHPRWTKRQYVLRDHANDRIITINHGKGDKATMVYDSHDEIDGIFFRFRDFREQVLDKLPVVL